jgi:hypothetical protein
MGALRDRRRDLVGLGRFRRLGRRGHAGAYAAPAPEHLDAAPPPVWTPRDVLGPLAWGAKVAPAFREKFVQLVSAWGGCTPSELMTCMASESGRSFRPDGRNMAGSGVTGLIQLIPNGAFALGTTCEPLAQMAPERAN